MCLQCFPTQENLTTQTLNPKVPSFAVPSFSLLKLSLFHFKKWAETLKQYINTVKIVPRYAKSWHGWCVSPKVRPTLSSKRAQQTEKRVTFSQNRVTIGHPAKHVHCLENRVTILFISNSQIWRQYQQWTNVKKIIKVLQINKTKIINKI